MVSRQDICRHREEQFWDLYISGMIILLNDRPVGDHGKPLLIDDGSFSIMEQADTVQSEIVDIYIFRW